MICQGGVHGAAGASATQGLKGREQHHMYCTAVSVGRRVVRPPSQHRQPSHRREPHLHLCSAQKFAVAPFTNELHYERCPGRTHRARFHLRCTLYFCFIVVVDLFAAGPGWTRECSIFFACFTQFVMVPGTAVSLIYSSSTVVDDLQYSYAVLLI